MDVLVSFAAKFGFTRLSSKLGKLIVFHCVPGAGKSSCIRAICEADSRFSAYTLGEPDCASLSGVRIAKYTGEVDADKLNLLDEYNVQEVDLSKFCACFGDPFQQSIDRNLRATFISKQSKRFGSATAQLLQSLNFDVEATGPDVVQIRGIYDSDPTEQIIYYEEEIGCLLRRHQVQARNIEEIIGATFDSVTFVTSHSILPKEERAQAYRCLTRHRRSLLILCPNATYTSA